MEDVIQPALAGHVIDVGTHRLNVQQSGYQPGDITEFGIITSDDFFRQEERWQTHNPLISAEVYGALALIWMPYPTGSAGQFYQFDGSISNSLNEQTIGTVMAVHGQMCELLLNVVPKLTQQEGA